MPAGLVSVVAVTAAVGGLIVWTMATHDPYWRLFETPSLPAPAYETAAEIDVALARLPLDAPRPDSAAERPARAGAGDPARLPDPPLAVLPPRPADPMIAVPAVPAAFAPAPDAPGTPATAPEAAPAGTHAAPRALAHAGAPGAAIPAAAVPETTVSVAAVPGPAAGDEPAAPPAPLPLAVTLHVPEASVGDAVAGLAALEPVAVPGTPDPLRIRADETSEEALALVRAERIRVQRRLALAGFDPRGFDGVFGPRTRRAIADFQLASGFPVTGYLDEPVLADLRARTEEAYAAYAARAARDRRAAPKEAPVAEERRLASADLGDGCARDAQGRIIPRQSFGCDIKGFAEKTVSLGRDRLAFEETGATALNGFGPGANR